MLCVQVGGEGRGGVVLIFYEFGLAKIKSYSKNGGVKCKPHVC